MSDPYRPHRLPWRHNHVEKIEVTLDHIMRGKQCSSHECPIALAVIEHFAAQFPGTHWGANVDDNQIGVYERDSGTDQWGYLHNGRAFLMEFDGYDPDGYKLEQGRLLYDRNTVSTFLLELYA